MTLSVLAAPSVTITSPTSDVDVIEGDEFFTDVLNDPIDFDKRRDIRWEENWDDSSITAGSGKWTGITGNDQAYIYVHFHGFEGDDSNPPANTGKIGANYPIDTSKYTGFSVMSAISSQNERSRKVLRWTRDLTNPILDDSGLYVQWLDAFIASVDGGTTNTTLIYHGAGETILDIRDLSGNSDWTGADITGLIYDQSISATGGGSETFEMMRVFDPDSAPTQKISWNFSELTSTGVDPRVNIYIDTNNSSFDGMFLARVPVNNGTGSDTVDGTGQYVIQTAALPPGTYYFYVEVMDAHEDTDDLIVRSGYSAGLTVNAKTWISFQNPSYTSGEDYATAVLGNPWDFEDEVDVYNLNSDESLKQFKDYLFMDGNFTATAYIPAANQSEQTETDAQIWLNTDYDSGNTPIDTSKYRYLTYQISMDPTDYTTISNKISSGWIVRLVWWENGNNIDGSVTGDILTYEDVHSYSIDLKNVTLSAVAEGSPQLGWTGIDQAKVFRIDPCETDLDTIFYLYDVKLTANPEPDYITFTFDIEYTTSDQESENATVEFYRDDDDSGFDGTSIGSESNVTPGTNSYSFSTVDLPQGDYYIYAVVTDEYGNVTKTYADVPMSVTQGEITGNLVPRYRLYNPYDYAHHYTTDLNEYNVLGSIGWEQEGIGYYVYDAAVTEDFVQATPFYRLYNPNNGNHHWTTDANEYSVLGTIGWTQEGVDSYIFLSQVTDSVPLYRLYNSNDSKHLWTIDLNEHDVLVGLGWNDEGIAGYVFNSSN